MHGGVAVATAGAAGAAAVAGTAAVEVATAAPVVLAAIQVDPKGAVEATTVPVVVGVAAEEVIVIHPPTAWRCRRRGHRREECTTKESNFVPRCARCSGFGHEESTCPSDASILVMELPDDDSEEQTVFAANATGKCSLRIGEEVVDGGLDKQVA